MVPGPAVPERRGANTDFLLWILVFAWSVDAALSSIPWLASAGSRLFTWIRTPVLRIVGLHVAGAVGPPLIAWAFWRGRDVAACLGLTGLAGSWLLFHISVFGDGSGFARFGPRLALCVVTLLVVLWRALRQARDAGREGA